MHPSANKPSASTVDLRSTASGLLASGCIISLIPRPGVQSSPIVLREPRARCVEVFKMICSACSETAHRAAYPVRVRLGACLTGRGDRIRQKLFPVRTHVLHSGENRKGGGRMSRYSAIHASHPILFYSALLCHKRSSVKSTTVQFSRRFISLFWS